MDMRVKYIHESTGRSSVVVSVYCNPVWVSLIKYIAIIYDKALPSNYANIRGNTGLFTSKHGFNYDKIGPILCQLDELKTPLS